MKCHKRNSIKFAKKFLGVDKKWQTKILTKYLMPEGYFDPKNFAKFEIRK